MILNHDELKRWIVELEPWHHDVDVVPGISTGYSREVVTPEEHISILRADKSFRRWISAVYPDGLAGKTFFENACNCGCYCFYAKEMGAEATFGFDVREHWIRQAEFLRENRAFPTDNMEFRVADLYDIPKLGLQPFDITWFSGIFYHLPDPVTGLKIAADLTREVLWLNTATINVLDPEPRDGALFASFEGTKHLMTGVHRLNWYPTGPKVLIHLLSWLGFPETRVVFWHKQVKRKTRPGDQKEVIGRIGIMAARKQGFLDGLKGIDTEE